MDAKRYVINANTDLYIGDPADGHDGDWIIQVLSITGTTPTLVPNGSLDKGATKVARKFSPIDGSADVASVNAAGIWTVKGPCPLVLTTTAADGACTLLAYPVVR